MAFENRSNAGLRKTRDMHPALQVVNPKPEQPQCLHTVSGTIAPPAESQIPKGPYYRNFLPPPTWLELTVVYRPQYPEIVA
eukprot:4646748-Amphidinium_carterae.1